MKRKDCEICGGFIAPSEIENYCCGYYCDGCYFNHKCKEGNNVNI